METRPGFLISVKFLPDFVGVFCVVTFKTPPKTTHELALEKRITTCQQVYPDTPRHRQVIAWVKWVKRNHEYLIFHCSAAISIISMHAMYKTDKTTLLCSYVDSSGCGKSPCCGKYLKSDFLRQVCAGIPHVHVNMRITLSLWWVAGIPSGYVMWQHAGGRENLRNGSSPVQNQESYISSKQLWNKETEKSQKNNNTSIGTRMFW